MKKRIFAVLMALCMMFSMTTVALAADAAGTEEDPIILEEAGAVTTKVAADNDDGVVYSYTVPDDMEGTIMITATVIDRDGAYVLNLDNKETSAYGQSLYHPEWGGDGAPGSVKAKAGEEIQFTVRRYGNNNELNLTWKLEVKAVGTSTSPEEIATMNQNGSMQKDFETILIPNAGAYYYSYEAEVAGTLSLYINENATVDPVVQYPDWNEEDPLRVNSINELKAEIVLKNVTKNVTDVYSEGTTNLTVSTGYGSDTYKVIQVSVEEGDEITVAVSSAATGYDDGVLMVWGALLQEPYGAAGNPVTPTVNNTEVTIPAGKAYYVNLNYPFMNYPITITGGTAEVYDYNGEKMEGQSDLEIPGEQITMWGDMEYKFQLKNPGTESVTYTLEFDMPLGIETNPEVLEGNSDSAEKDLEASYDGYFYSWKAPADGILSIDLESKTAEKGWRAVVNPANGEMQIVFDPEEKDIILEVSKDEVVMIQVYATVYGEPDPEAEEIIYDYLWEPAEGTVVTSVEFEATSGNVVDKEHVAEVIDQIESGEVEDNTVHVNVTITEDGELGEVIDENATVIPADILAAVKEYNKDASEDEVINIMFWAGNYAWYIDGSSIENTNPIDLGITFDTNNTPETTIEAIANGDEYKTFTIAHDGEFGFTAALTFAIDVEENPTFVGKKAVLYHDNEGKLEKVGEATIGADGLVAYGMAHASDYVIIVEGTAVVEDTTPDNTTDADKAPVEAPKTGDTSNYALWIAVLGLGVVAMATSVVMKKREF